jgi:hypothetical protein
MYWLHENENGNHVRLLSDNKLYYGFDGGPGLTFAEKGLKSEPVIVHPDGRIEFKK